MITTLAVSGMSCNGCVRHVDKALREVPGVTDVRVDLPGGRVTIEHLNETAVASMIEAIDAAGYSAQAA